ncbi:unnamed protein product, partial [marine sediment metagenome]
SVEEGKKIIKKMTNTDRKYFEEIENFVDIFKEINPTVIVIEDISKKKEKITFLKRKND